MTAIVEAAGIGSDARADRLGSSRLERRVHGDGRRALGGLPARSSTSFGSGASRRHSSATARIRPAAIVDRLGLDEAFDEIMLSFEVGLAKPDPAIYREALRRAGRRARAAPSSSTISRTYCDGAASIGIETYLIDRTGDATPDENGHRGDPGPAGAPSRRRLTSSPAVPASVIILVTSVTSDGFGSSTSTGSPNAEKSTVISMLRVPGPRDEISEVHGDPLAARQALVVDPDLERDLPVDAERLELLDRGLELFLVAASASSPTTSAKPSSTFCRSIVPMYRVVATPSMSAPPEAFTSKTPANKPDVGRRIGRPRPEAAELRGGGGIHLRGVEADPRRRRVSRRPASACRSRRRP